MKKKATVYSTTYCPYCVRAKNLLQSKGIEFEEIDLSHNEALKQKIMQQTGLRTVPQIFIDNQFVGGYQELEALNQAGKL